MVLWLEGGQGEVRGPCAGLARFSSVSPHDDKEWGHVPPPQPPLPPNGPAWTPPPPRLTLPDPPPPPQYRPGESLLSG